HLRAVRGRLADGERFRLGPPRHLRPAPSHALAGIPKHARPRSARDLRVLVSHTPRDAGELFGCGAMTSTFTPLAGHVEDGDGVPAISAGGARPSPRRQAPPRTRSPACGRPPVKSRTMIVPLGGIPLGNRTCVQNRLTAGFATCRHEANRESYPMHQ